MRRHAARPRGQALVEFALVLPLLVVILLGIFDLGRAVYAFNTVSNAAREATRVAIVDQTVATIQAKAAQRAVSLGIDPADVQVAFINADQSNNKAPCNVPPGPNWIAPVPVGCLAQVTVVFHYDAAIPLIGNLVGPITISSTSRLAVERSFP